jgi:hypothetical protein
LCYDRRLKRPRFRGSLNEKAINEHAEPFDTEVKSSTAAAATGRGTGLAVPRYILFQNRTREIPDPRRRRVLRELHHAAALQEPGAVASDADGNPVSLYDPNIRIFASRANLDQWRVYFKGPAQTPYAGRWWYIFVTFPDEYPVRPPLFQFISVPYHMNVSAE